MSREAMKLALEALEAADWYINQLEITLYSADDAGTHEDRLKVQQAITVLRLEIDALNMASKPALAEQPYPENFIDALKYDAAKRDFWEGYVPEPDKRQQALDKKAENARELGLDYEPDSVTCQKPYIAAEGWEWVPLYTTPQPPAQRTWQGLTDDEINDLVHNHDDFDGLWEFAEAVEAKLKEKNT